VGLSLSRHARRAAGQPLRIGVTGLGIGGLAAYARSNDVIRFYEINPAVIALAAGPNALFGYVGECDGQVNIVPGDARLSQERELREGRAQEYDVLILDAFSSDSIPVHLLTLEAFETYVRQLRDGDSIIAVNISNRFLDLRPLAFGVAARMGLQAALFYCEGDPPQPAKSMWVLMSRNGAFFRQEAVRARRHAYRVVEDVVWTDGYSNLFALLRWD
jgi:hypothetical protein